MRGREYSGLAALLEVVRRLLNDREGRKKDSKYREAAERERLRLENQILQNEAFRGQINNLKELGLTTDELRPLVRQLVLRPLIALGRQQDRGMIQGVETGEEDSTRE